MGTRFDLLNHGVEDGVLTRYGSLMITPNKLVGEFLSEYD